MNKINKKDTHEQKRVYKYCGRKEELQYDTITAWQSESETKIMEQTMD